ncbi:Xaa-Pro aminopeptidase [Mesotoga prima MesG1.Ag.4.2]|uniref:Xaa-Pro aminopeptidase n=1 Tax=Mesotoga prima MesG1.Ag.4.2 TaxID=660470 RepID=I2F4D1_9BACT|nr:M24 family metallopeptidase [Mesotoga prima]AFK06784.1 Xaa-Pro aminopeptidase [Mesotoga prima MesG1.Ag.4.2]
MTRHDTVKAYIDEASVEAVLFTRNSNIQWFFEGEVEPRIDTSTDMGAFWLLITSSMVIALCPNYDVHRIRDEILPKDVEVLGFDGFSNSVESAGRLCDKFSKVAVDSDLFFPSSSYVSIGRDFYEKTQLLSEREILRLRVTGKLTENIICEFAPELQPGMTELEVEKVLRAIFIESGLEVPTLCIASDERISKSPYPVSTVKKISRYLMLRATIRKQGLSVSLSRYFHFGAIPQEIEQRHERASGIAAKGAVAIMRARTMGEVYEEIKNAYASLNAANEIAYYSPGGTTGYTQNTFLFAPDSQITMKHPATYVLNPLIGGLLSEDTVLLNSDGNAEFLTLGEDFPKVKVRLESFRVHRPWIMII